jgi:hypothetical protein
MLSRRPAGGTLDQPTQEYAVISLSVLALLGAVAPAALARDPETTLDIVAAAVRERGFACDRPRSVARDPSASEPDRAAWIIQCEGERYRVIFEGDTGPRVTPVE